MLFSCWILKQNNLFSMCISNITIKNRRLDFDDHFHKAYLRVPCGHCPECRENRRRDYEARCIAEWFRVRSLNGCAYMYTLTYNNEHLPFFDSQPCFCKTDVQSFLRKFRKLLDEKAGHHSKFTYFVVSEYGGSTHRPHYHIIVFFDESFDFGFVYDLFVNSWLNGFVEPCKHGGMINSVAGLIYVCKYCCKDFSFEVSSRLHQSKRYSIEKDSSYIERSKFSKHFDKFRPFHLESLGFGSYLDHFINDASLKLGKVFLPCMDGNCYRQYNIPLYNLRRFLYRKEFLSTGSIRYVLNEKGIKIRLDKLSQGIDNLSLCFESCFDMPDSVLSMSEVLSHLGFTRLIDVKHHILSVLNGSDFHDLAEYSIVYRGFSDRHAMTGNIQNDYLYSLCDQSWQIDLPFPPDDDQVISKLLANESYFDGFDYCLSLLYILLSISKYLVFVKKTDSWNSKERLKLLEHQDAKLDLRPMLSFKQFINTKIRSYGKTQISYDESCCSDEFTLS